MAKLDPIKGFKLERLKTTEDIVIPNDPLKRVVGQDKAIELAMIAAKQRRNLLFVGPPGTGKSMIAQAMSFHIPKPTTEIYVVHNPENPERPFIEEKDEPQIEREKAHSKSASGKIISAIDAPTNVAEKLGYRCEKCGTYSPPSEFMCPNCNIMKGQKGEQQVQVNQPFGDLIQNLGGIVQQMTVGAPRKAKSVKTTRKVRGKEEVVSYEPESDTKIRVLDQDAMEKRHEMEMKSPKKVLLSVSRNPFVLATGASETEFLGDVRHDPYGGHGQLGTPPYERVIAGAIHEAHQGLLYIDELPHLGHLQRFILTAMQDKTFSISGRNPQSAGAAVKVEEVPCDFVFVGACNIQDLPNILSPLRSRIVGNGYEILMETAMPDNAGNRVKIAQFIAQEIAMDTRIPPADLSAVKEIISEAKKRAEAVDGQKKCLSLRLRELGGLIRSAGDIAVMENAKVISKKHIKKAVERNLTAEQQIKERYGTYHSGLARDISASQRDTSPYNYWDQHLTDDKKGYE